MAKGDFLLRRILVIGNSGAGKSTLARELAERLDLPAIASDPLYWEKGWVPTPASTVRERITDVVAEDSWVIDGNFITDRDIVWQRADTIVWLDYSLPLILWRVVTRNLRWLLTQERVWSDNKMTVARAWSGIRHAVKSYPTKRGTYPDYLAQYPHLKIFHFRSPKETKRWLKQK